MPILPKYDISVVEAVILEEVAKLEPDHLSAGNLLRRIVSNPKDAKEIETGLRAIRNLQKVGLLIDRIDEPIEPTPAALRAVALLR